MQRLSGFSGLFVVALLVLMTSSVSSTTEVPRQFNYQGYLRDSNADPVTDIVNFQFYIYPDFTGGSPCWGPETHLNVEVVGGFFELQLGSQNPIDPACFDGARKWLEIWVGGAPLAPRKPINSVPYAFESTTGGIGGSGTQGFLPKFADSTTVENSQIFDDGTNVGVGEASPTHKLDVAGVVRSSSGGFKFPDGSVQTTSVTLGSYDSGWFAVDTQQSGGVGYGLTHSLGTTSVIWQVYTASDQSGSDMHLMPFNDDTSTITYGCQLKSITTTTCRLYFREGAYVYSDWESQDNSRTGYARVIGLALE